MRDMIVDISKFKNYLMYKEMSYKVRLHRISDLLKRTLRLEGFSCRILRSCKLLQTVFIVGWRMLCC